MSSAHLRLLHARPGLLGDVVAEPAYAFAQASAAAARRPNVRAAVYPAGAAAGTQKARARARHLLLADPVNLRIVQVGRAKHAAHGLDPGKRAVDVALHRRALKRDR